MIEYGKKKKLVKTRTVGKKQNKTKLNSTGESLYDQEQNNEWSRHRKPEKPKSDGKNLYFYAHLHTHCQMPSKVITGFKASAYQNELTLLPVSYDIIQTLKDKGIYLKLHNISVKAQYNQIIAVMWKSSTWKVWTDIFTHIWICHFLIKNIGLKLKLITL